MALNQAQLKLLANFCSEIAKGALLSGLGLTYLLPADAVLKFIFVVPAIFVAIFSLLFALGFARLIID